MKPTHSEVPLKFFNLLGASELRSNRAVVTLIAVSIVLGLVIFQLTKMNMELQETNRALQNERVMYGFPSAEGVFVSSKHIPETHLKGFASVFVDNYFNFTPESAQTNAEEALRMMSSRLRALQEDKLKTLSKQAFEQQITQVFAKTGEYKVEPYKNLGYVLSFTAKRHRVTLNDVYDKRTYVVKLLIKPVKPSKHFEWAVVVDDFQIEETSQ